MLVVEQQHVTMPTSMAHRSRRPFDMQWKNATDPYEGKWPGLRPNQVEHADGMDITWDVAVPMRDGVKLYVDIFRPEPAKVEKLPIILTYSPYGKHGPKTFEMFPNSGVPAGSVSKYAVWEGPDPLFWTQQGYAVINADTRGSWGSEGDCTILSPEQGKDGYDLVEWAASLPWSNGRVGMGGVSYLAIVQWRVAEQQPPHLACIMPWEGFTDTYRDYAHHGGIPETNFVKFTEWSCRCGLGKVEDWVTMQKEHHMFDAYQQSKAVDLLKITCPAYVVADWGDQGLHTRGSLRGFSEVSSKQKWLEVHGQKKWQYYYQPASLQKQKAFYRKFLKKHKSVVDTWPRVQLEVRDKAYRGIVRAENEWPLARTKPVKKYLDACLSKILDDLPNKGAAAIYDSEVESDQINFTYMFEHATELTGSMRLRLWVSTEDSRDEGSDMDIFVQVDKLSATGRKVPFVAMSMIDTGPLALGWLRVSHRELDVDKSTTFAPYLLHQREMKLRKGEIVPVDIEIWPSSTRFDSGECLQLTVQGSDVFRYGLAQVQLHQDSVNRGKHFVHCGGIWDSYLVMPVVE